MLHSGRPPYAIPYQIFSGKNMSACVSLGARHMLTPTITLSLGLLRIPFFLFRFRLSLLVSIWCLSRSVVFCCLIPFRTWIDVGVNVHNYNHRCFPSSVGFGFDVEYCNGDCNFYDNLECGACGYVNSFVSFFLVPSPSIYSSFVSLFSSAFAGARCWSLC